MTTVLDLTGADTALDLELLFAAASAPVIVWGWAGSEFEETLKTRPRLRSLLEQIPDTHSFDFHWLDRPPTSPWAQTAVGPASTRIVEVSTLDRAMPAAVYPTGDTRSGVVTLPARWSTTDFVRVPERSLIPVEDAVGVIWAWMRDSVLPDGFSMEPAIPGPWRRNAS
jgi:hypothetical protein